MALLVAVVAGVAFVVVRAPARGCNSSASGTTFYVSPQGSDRNRGTGSSPQCAWKTVGRVNATRFAAGSAVLFQGGETFADADLEPASAGTSGSPIAFGSYGSGRATISRGAFFVHHDYITLRDLNFADKVQGGSDLGDAMASHVTIRDCSVSLPPGNRKAGLVSNGDDWTIERSTVANTGDSGMLLRGDRYLIRGDTILNSGLVNLGYGEHGIYLKASDATVADNTITGFRDDGVSVRYRNSVVSGNRISGGAIGIAWFQYDTKAGISRWENNAISRVHSAGVYVSSKDAGTQTIESFVIAGNRITVSRTVPYYNLQPTTGSYSLTPATASPGLLIFGS